MVTTTEELDRRLSYLTQLVGLVRRSTPEQVATCRGAVRHILMAAQHGRIMALTVIDGAPPPPIPEAERDRVAKLLTNTIKLAFGGAR